MIQKSVVSGMYKIPPFNGEHFWIVLVAYQVIPEIVSMPGPSSIDHENAVSVEGPFCCYCDKVLTNHQTEDKCSGE